MAFYEFVTVKAQRWIIDWFDQRRKFLQNVAIAHIERPGCLPIQ